MGYPATLTELFPAMVVALGRFKDSAWSSNWPGFRPMLTHIHTHTLTHTYTHTLSLSYTHTLICKHTHSFTHTHKYTHAHKHTPSLSHTRTPSLSLTHTHTHTHVHTHAHTLSDTQTHISGEPILPWKVKWALGKTDRESAHMVQHCLVSAGHAAELLKDELQEIQQMPRFWLAG